MPSRRRGAAVLLAALLAGRLLDRFDLPFENSGPPPRQPGSASPAAPARPAPDAAFATPGSLAAGGDASPRGGPASHPTRSRRTPARHRAPAGPVRVNHATAAELQSLPGVGPVLAQRIVAFRTAHGPLRSAADLERVQGIGTRTAARLAPHLRFD
jgi:competence protein ComEA